MGDQSLQVMLVYVATKFNWHGEGASVLSGRFMAFLGNGDVLPAVSMMVVADANAVDLIF